jgi:nitroreductase
MYGLVGITKDNREGMREQTGRNYTFFDAPVGMIFTIDQDMHWGSWLDCGMFLENVMLAARGQGLETCPQAAFANYHKVVREVLGLKDSDAIICGMSLGTEDKSSIINELVTDREPVEAFTTFHEG